MFDQLNAAGPRTIARVFETSLSAEPAHGDELRRCVLLVGALDPMVSPGVLERAQARFAIPEPNIHHLATGGHFPHLESADFPEHTARNIDHIVELIDAMLIATRQGTLLSTQLESTVISDGASNSME